MPRPLWREPVFFLHIPKVAGTSIRHFLEGCLLRHEHYRIVSVPAEIETRASTPLSEEIKFVSGHAPFWYSEAFRSRARTLTILRNPIERALSTWRFWKGLPPPADADHSEEARLLRAVQAATLEEFAANRDGVWWGAINNYATWLIGHDKPWNLTAGFDEGMAALARTRLRTIELLGVVERLSPSMRLIASDLGIPQTRPVPQLNSSSPSSEADLVSPSIVRALTEANEHDMALWEDANLELSRRLERSPRTAVPLAALSDSRFAPRCVQGRYELTLGKDPLLCEGWLPPEEDDFGSWRFAAAPGPAELYLQWPVGSGDFAIVIKSPFCAPGFNYEAVEVSVDGNTIGRIVAQFHDHVCITTAAIPRSAAPLRRLTLSYPDPHLDERTHASHSNQIAFAVTSISWMECTSSCWDAVLHINGLLSTEVRSLREAAKARALDIQALEEMILKKDNYIASLLAALEEKAISSSSAVRDLEAMIAKKDEYIASLLAALEEKAKFERETANPIGSRSATGRGRDQSEIAESS
jgi:hypothetical protein